MKRVVIAGLLLMLSQGLALGQNIEASDTTIAGISIASGLSMYANTDRYISGDRYAGAYTPIRFDWNRFRSGRGFHFGVAITNIPDLENDDIPNLVADLTDVKISLDHYFAITPFQLFNKEARLFLGPGYGIHFYERKQR